MLRVALHVVLPTIGLWPGPTPASPYTTLFRAAEMVGRSLVPVMANDTVVAADAPCVSMLVMVNGSDGLAPASTTLVSGSPMLTVEVTAPSAVLSCTEP